MKFYCKLKLLGSLHVYIQRWKCICIYMHNLMQVECSQQSVPPSRVVPLGDDEKFDWSDVRRRRAVSPDVVPNLFRPRKESLVDVDFDHDRAASGEATLSTAAGKGAIMQGFRGGGGVQAFSPLGNCSMPPDLTPNARLNFWFMDFAPYFLKETPRCTVYRECRITHIEWSPLSESPEHADHLCSPKCHICVLKLCLCSNDVQITGTLHVFASACSGLAVLSEVELQGMCDEMTGKFSRLSEELLTSLKTRDVLAGEMEAKNRYSQLVKTKFRFHDFLKRYA